MSQNPSILAFHPWYLPGAERSAPHAQDLGGTPRSQPSVAKKDEPNVKDPPVY